jgi:hypothetical protein
MSSLVFISYSRANSDKANAVHQFIQEEVGFPAFLDTSNIEMGHAWKSLINNSLDTCFAVVVLLSGTAAESNYVTYEWAYAKGKGKKIIPLVIDAKLSRDKVNEFLKDTQYSMEFIDPQPEDWAVLKNRLAELRELSDIPEEVIAGSKLARDPLPPNRAAGIKLLEDYAHEAASRELRTLALDDAWGERQIDAALALAKKSNYIDEAAIKGLERAVTERTYEKKEAAKDCLAQIGTLEAAEALYRAYNSLEKHEDERERIVRYLSNFTNPDIVPVLLTLVHRDNVPNLLMLYHKLAEFQEETIISEICEKILAKKLDFEGIQRCISMLGMYKSDAAIQPLYDLYIKYEHENPNFADQILAILGKSGKQNALDLLETRLNDTNIRYARAALRNAVNKLKAGLE